MTSKIIGVGNYIPSETISNLFFGDHVFLNEEGNLLKDSNESITKKLQKIKEDTLQVRRLLPILVLLQHNLQ